MRLTLSVRSAHAPVAPFTRTWPPSVPSVPTSRATRVTSAAKDESWSVIALTALATRRYSPLAARPSDSSGMRCEKSPRATASTTRPISAVGRTRSSISSLTAPRLVAQAPLTCSATARSAMRAVAPDRAAHARQLLARALLPLGHAVVGVRELAHDAAVARGQAGAEVPGGRGVEGAQEVVQRARRRCGAVRAGLRVGHRGASTAPTARGLQLGSHAPPSPSNGSSIGGRSERPGLTGTDVCERKRRAGIPARNDFRTWKSEDSASRFPHVCPYVLPGTGRALSAGPQPARAVASAG